MKRVKQNVTRRKKKRQDDTIAEDEQEPTQQPTSKEMSKEAMKKGKSKEKERASKDKMSASGEKAEKEKDLKFVAATKGLCKYILDMKEASLNTYFDANLANYSPSKCTFNEWEKNVNKNRTKDVKLIDATRVVLTNPEKSKMGPADDVEGYINASHIRFDNASTDYILTQYPLPSTIRDFWKMVYVTKVTQVITIFEPIKDEAIEEFANFPAPASPVPPPPTASSKDIGSSPDQQPREREQIEIKSIRCDNHLHQSFFPLSTDHYLNLEGWLINTRAVEVDQRCKNWMNKYTVEVVADGCSEATFAKVYNCTTWPWKSYPDDVKKVLALVRAPVKESSPTVGKQPPVIVMCDLGLDRSATVVLTSIIIEQVLDGKTPDCDDLFRKMRDQRAGVFTMSIFFTYAIRAALFYLKLKLQCLNENGNEDVKTMITEALAKVPFLTKKAK